MKPLRSPRGRPGAPRSSWKAKQLQNLHQYQSRTHPVMLPGRHIHRCVTNSGTLVHRDHPRVLDALMRFQVLSAMQLAGYCTVSATGV